MAHQRNTLINVKPLHILCPRFSAIFLFINTFFVFISSPSLAAIKQDTKVIRLAPPLEQQNNIIQKSDSAEALYVISDTTIKEDGHWEKRSYTSIRVNDADSARDYGRIVIPYNHYYSDIELEFANTVSAEGKVIALSADALQTRVTGGGQDFYSDSSEIVFSLPDISPGSILEFQVLAKSKHLALPELYSERSSPYWVQSTVSNDGWRADYVHNYHNSITSPNNRTIHHKPFSGFTSKPKKTSTNTDTTLSWEMTSINGIKSETWMPLPREFMPSLHISTLNNWSEIDRWSWGKIEDKLSDPTIESVASSLMLDKNASNEDKIRAVYQYLQNNVRYVFAHLGRGGYEPHHPKDVLGVNYGDCKDQSVLAVALLRKLGVNAYPALIETPRAGDSDIDTVSLIFDHMIVHIPESEGTHTRWLDTTGDQSLYPGVSNFLANQNVLIVNGKGGSLEKFPSLGPNSATINIDFYADTETQSRAEVEFLFEGDLESNLRSWWLHSTYKENALNQYLATLYSTNDSIRAEVRNSTDLWFPATIESTFTFNSATENENHSFAASITQALRMFSSLSQLPLPETKQTRFYDPYPYELHMNFRVHGDKHTSPILIQSADARNTPFFDLEYTSKTSDTHYQLHIHFKKPALNLSQQEYEQYYKTIKRIEDENVWLVKLINNTHSEKSLAIDQIKSNKGEESLEFLIAKTRHLLEEGQFLDALIPAKKAVSMTKRNGEVWYILGMAQGFNAMIEESSNSFKKAEELGYIP